MKKFLEAFVLSLALLVAPAVFAQSATQQSATRLDSAGQVATSTTSAATITITPGAGQFVYITGVEITNCAGSSAVSAAAVTTVTTTGLNGSPVWTVGSGVSAGLCQPSPASGQFSSPLKSATAGAAVTFVLPTFATNQTLRVQVYYYLAA